MAAPRRLLLICCAIGLGQCALPPSQAWGKAFTRLYLVEVLRDDGHTKRPWLPLVAVDGAARGHMVGRISLRARLAPVAGLSDRVFRELRNRQLRKQDIKYEHLMSAVRAFVGTAYVGRPVSKHRHHRLPCRCLGSRTTLLTPRLLQLSIPTLWLRSTEWVLERLPKVQVELPPNIHVVGTLFVTSHRVVLVVGAGQAPANYAAGVPSNTPARRTLARRSSGGSGFGAGGGAGSGAGVGGEGGGGLHSHTDSGHTAWSSRSHRSQMSSDQVSLPRGTSMPPPLAIVQIAVGSIALMRYAPSTQTLKIRAKVRRYGRFRVYLHVVT